MSAKAEVGKSPPLIVRQAALIGRQDQMAQLQEALRKLLAGQGTIVSVCGALGTGKTRLLREFKSTLDLGSVRWYEGHTYASVAHVPYYLFTDLLKWIFDIQEGDWPEQAREKAEKKVMSIMAAQPEIIPYVGELLSMSYPELERIDIDLLQSRLKEAVVIFLSALAQQGPSVFCFEDLHWTEATTLELLRLLWGRLTHPALFLCTYRPPLALLGDDPPEHLLARYQEIRLPELNPAQSRDLVASLLKTQGIPRSLERLVAGRVASNPFYVEELVNFLLEADLLYTDQGTWHFREPAPDQALPAAVEDLIQIRLERFDDQTREVLRAAAVIGRVFSRAILQDVTASSHLNQSLQILQDRGIMALEAAHPEMVYAFRHVLFQETVYRGLSEAHRQDLHEGVGLALEKFFQDRSMESWETLAFHFQRGHSLDKAVTYLLQSAQRCLKKYALQASAQYYSQAFDLLARQPHRSATQDRLLVNLVLNWCLVLYYQGCFKDMSRLLLEHLFLAESLEDREKLGEYYAWLGHATFWHGASLKDAYHFLHRALELTQAGGNRHVLAYCYGFLIKVCAELGLLEESEAHARRCRELLEAHAEDYFLNMMYYSGKGYIGWFTGNKAMIQEAGQDILSYGRETQSLRCQMVGYILLAFWHFLELNTAEARKLVQKVIDEGDPYHSIFARSVLGMFLVHLREFQPAQVQLQRVIGYSDEHGTEYMKTYANVFLGVALAAQGDLAAGLRLLEGSNRDFREFHRQVFYCMSETILGTIYLQLYQRSGKKSLSLLWRNKGVILKNLFGAGKKAEKHFLTAVSLAQETGARGFLGQPYLQLGALYKAWGEYDRARHYLSQAYQTFTACDMQTHAQRARDLLDDLN